LNLFMPAMPVESTDLNRSRWMSVQKWTAEEELEVKSQRPNILLGSRTALEGDTTETKNESESEAAERDALYLYVDLPLVEPVRRPNTKSAVQ